MKKIVTVFLCLALVLTAFAACGSKEDTTTAAKVLSLSDSLIKENNLMTMMVTHNMHDAIVYGNRLIMMHEGRIILDISGEEKKNLTVDMLLHKFEEVSGSEFVNDRALLSK